MYSSFSDYDHRPSNGNLAATATSPSSVSTHLGATTSGPMHPSLTSASASLDMGLQPKGHQRNTLLPMPEEEEEGASNGHDHVHPSLHPSHAHTHGHPRAHSQDYHLHGPHINNNSNNNNNSIHPQHHNHNHGHANAHDNNLLHNANNDDHHHQQQPQQQQQHGPHHGLDSNGQQVNQDHQLLSFDSQFGPAEQDSFDSHPHSQHSQHHSQPPFLPRSAGSNPESPIIEHRKSIAGTTPYRSPPYAVRSRRAESLAFSENGPYFSNTKQYYSIHSMDRTRQYNLRVMAKIDRGFFLAESNWTCYRRNYFQVSTAYSILGFNHNLDSDVPCILEIDDNQGGSPSFETITQFLVCISSRVQSTDKKIDLVQHTPKRDKGPQMVPDPRPISGGGNLTLTSISANQNIVTFERVQFKTATANNGKRRAAQQFYVIQVDLYGATESGHLHCVASTQSASLVVRGRSPGHYADNHERYNPVLNGSGMTSPLHSPDDRPTGYAHRRGSSISTVIGLASPVSPLSGSDYGSQSGHNSHPYASSLPSNSTFGSYAGQQSSYNTNFSTPMMMAGPNGSGSTHPFHVGSSTYYSGPDHNPDSFHNVGPGNEGTHPFDGPEMQQQQPQHPPQQHNPHQQQHAIHSSVAPDKLPSLNTNFHHMPPSQSSPEVLSPHGGHPLGLNIQGLSHNDAPPHVSHSQSYGHHHSHHGSNTQQQQHYSQPEYPPHGEYQPPHPSFHPDWERNRHNSTTSIVSYVSSVSPQSPHPHHHEAGPFATFGAPAPSHGHHPSQDYGHIQQQQQHQPHTGGSHGHPSLQANMQSSQLGPGPILGPSALDSSVGVSGIVSGSTLGHMQAPDGLVN